MNMYSRSSKAGIASQRIQLAKSLDEQIEQLSPNASTSKKVKLERFMHRIAQVRDENEDKDLNMHQQVVIKKQLERAKEKFSPEPKHPILAVYKQYRDLGECGLEVTPFEPSRIERILSGLERIDQDKNKSTANEDLNFDQISDETKLLTRGILPIGVIEGIERRKENDEMEIMNYLWRILKNRVEE